MNEYYQESEAQYPAKETNVKLFENKKVRSVWDDEQEKWYISIVDVIEALTESNRPRKYWDDLKRKLQAEGSELSEKIGQLKMQSSDGKFYKTGKKIVNSMNAKSLKS